MYCWTISLENKKTKQESAVYSNFRIFSELSTTHRCCEVSQTYELQNELTIKYESNCATLRWQKYCCYDIASIYDKYVIKSCRVMRTFIHSFIYFRQLRSIDTHKTYNIYRKKEHRKRDRQKETKHTHETQYYYHRLTACWQNFL